MYAAGDTIAGFPVERRLGRGGMGEVYLVRHPRLQRLDALKVLREEASADPHYVERFQREALLAARLDHDNVLPVYDCGEAGGQLWIHMKYVAGEDAAAALRSDGPFSARRVVNVVSKVASALDHAHSHGLLHRDVKPANILLGRPSVAGQPERVYLSDFGIAKRAGDAADLTPDGRFAASLDYAAPEQIQMLELDGRADQYALGCVVFQLLTGSVPYPVEGDWAKMNAHLASPLPKVGLLRPGLPPAVQSVVERALAKSPADRYESCSAMARALEVSLRGLPDAPATDVFAAPIERAPIEPPPIEPPPIEPPPVDPPTDVLQDVPRDQLGAPPQLQPPAPWWTHVDRAAGFAAIGAVLLSLAAVFPPTPARLGSPYPGEIATGRFAAGQLPAAVLLVIAVLLQATRSGHRYRSLLYGIAGGAGAYALIDSVRAYLFCTHVSSTGASLTGAYAGSAAHTDGALPRAVIGAGIVVAAALGVRRAPRRPRPRPGPHLLASSLLAVTGVVLVAVAVGVGPRLQGSRIGDIAYGVPFLPSLGAAALLGLAAWSRRVPVLAAAVTLSLASLVASLAAADPLRYPIAVVGDVLLLVAAGVLVVGARRLPLEPPPAWVITPPTSNPMSPRR